LQAALWQEAFWLVEQGIATVADIDTAIRMDRDFGGDFSARS